MNIIIKYNKSNLILFVLLYALLKYFLKHNDEAKFIEQN